MSNDRRFNLVNSDALDAADNTLLFAAGLGAARWAGSLDCEAARARPRHRDQRGQQVGPDTQDTTPRSAEVSRRVLFSSSGRFLIF